MRPTTLPSPSPALRLDFIRHFRLASVNWSSVEIVAPAVTDEAGRVHSAFLPDQCQSRTSRGPSPSGEGGRSADCNIGDGISDLWAALSADLAFAVRGSRLHSELERCGKRHGAFTDLGRWRTCCSPRSFPGDELRPEFMQ